MLTVRSYHHKQSFLLSREKLGRESFKTQIPFSLKALTGCATKDDKCLVQVAYSKDKLCMERKATISAHWGWHTGQTLSRSGLFVG